MCDGIKNLLMLSPNDHGKEVSSAENSHYIFTCRCQSLRRTRGGYEYDFVDDPIPERFQCSICTKVLRDARLTECCGQHFCDSCLSSWMKQQKTCPHCRKAHFQSIINKERNRDINELRIRCTNREEGCDWVGEMGVLEDHLKSGKGCGYVIVKCDNRGMDYELCGKSLERRHLTYHKENECKYRPYTCEYCGHKDTFKGIAMGYDMSQWMESMEKVPSHYEECDQYPLECPNKCGETNIKRKDVEEHCEICPLEPLKCRFKVCRKTIHRKDMDSHKRECEYRPYSCEYCGHDGTFRSITGKTWGCHYSRCDQYPLKCPNDCGERNIKRRDMKGHRDICPLEPLNCPFKDADCTDKIQRKDMEKHIESSTQQHLLKSHQKLMKAYQQLKKLKKSYRKLKERMEDLDEDTSLSDTSESECDDFSVTQTSYTLEISAQGDRQHCDNNYAYMQP